VNTNTTNTSDQDFEEMQDQQEIVTPPSKQSKMVKIYLMSEENRVERTLRISSEICINYMDLLSLNID